MKEEVKESERQIVRDREEEKEHLVASVIISSAVNRPYPTYSMSQSLFSEKLKDKQKSSTSSPSSPLLLPPPPPAWANRQSGAIRGRPITHT